jgi:hypothetical protein
MNMRRFLAVASVEEKTVRRDARASWSGSVTPYAAPHTYAKF